MTRGLPLDGARQGYGGQSALDLVLAMPEGRIVQLDREQPRVSPATMWSSGQVVKGAGTLAGLGGT